MFIFEAFFIKAMLGAIIVAMASAPYGCIVIWQKMGFFGDAISHSALLALALALILDLDPQVFSMVVVAMLALGFSMFARAQDLSNDIYLAVITYAASAIAGILFSKSGQSAAYFMAFLFGDILTITNSDLIIIGLSAAFSALVAFATWKSMVDFSIDGELGIQSSRNTLAAFFGSRKYDFSRLVTPERVRMVFVLSLALIIASMIKIVGALLVVAIMVTPAASARRFYLSTSPERMLGVACAISFLSVIIGAVASVYMDTPTGATIAVVCFGFFIVSRFMRQQA